MFPSMDPWEIALWIVATYVAVGSLARLMLHERDRQIARRRDELRSERRRQAQMLLLRRRRAAARRNIVGHDPAR
jgi:hypothetical protein